MEAQERTVGKASVGELDAETALKHKLFDRHVTPYVNMIYKLCIKYTFDPQNVEDNYTEVLANLYKYIHTYDEKRSIRTWLHIVTKRFIIDVDSKRQSLHLDIDPNDIWDGDFNASIEDACEPEEPSYRCMDETNYKMWYNDDIIDAIEGLRPIYREALLLQMAGYKLNEIVDISYKNGNLKTKNIETVKSRLFLAKKEMRRVINRDGQKITN